MNIVIAGATGFVGSALMDSLAVNSNARVRALSRSPSAIPFSEACWGSKAEFVHCDLYSLLQVETLLAGADICVYLIHSMTPNSKLVQGDFSNCDLLLADNFARAAKKNKIGHIVYLSGMQPCQSSKNSHHLHSRLEVERCLGAYDTPVLVLRAGMIIGAGGASTELLFRVVERMLIPFFLLPPWTRTKSSPVALSDAVGAINQLILTTDLKLINKARKIGPQNIYIYEAHCNQIVSYGDILKEVCDIFGRKPRFLSIPAAPDSAVALLICLLTKLPFKLVHLLIQSLKIDLVPSDSLKYEFAGSPKTLTCALTEAILERQKYTDHAKPSLAPQSQIEPVRLLRSVASIQRLALPAGWDSSAAANEYLAWLPNAFHPFIKVTTENGIIEFYFLWIKKSLLTLELAPLRSDVARTLFFIRGGILDGKRNKLRGRLEFRVIDGALVAAVLDFEPALPWMLYRYTQAVVHLFVMWLFSKHLKKQNT